MKYKLQMIYTDEFGIEQKSFPFELDISAPMVEIPTAGFRDLIRLEPVYPPPKEFPGDVPPDEMLDSGIIQEINRQLLHPRGLAMFVDTDTGAMGLFRTDDPEGWDFVFEDPELARTKTERFDALLKDEAVRVPAVGAMVQPLPEVES